MSGVKLLQIQAYGCDAQVYYVQKTFLASVSPKLAEHCHQQPTNLDISKVALHIFLTWLITRDNDGIKEVGGSQMALAQAWNFGAQYDMPDFQDAVMRQLVCCLSAVDYVSPDAAREAYATIACGTRLQRALIAQLAIDMRRSDHAWPRNYFTDHCLQGVPEFLLDLTEAMREADSQSHLKVNDFLYKH